MLWALFQMDEFPAHEKEVWWRCGGGVGGGGGSEGEGVWVEVHTGCRWRCGGGV